MVSLCVSINSIYTWLNTLPKYRVTCLFLSREDERNPFKNPTEKKPTLEDITRKRQTISTNIEGEWYLNNMCKPKPSIKKQG